MEEGYDINEIINKIKEKDPLAYITLPFENVDDEEKSLKENLEENEIMSKLNYLCSNFQDKYL